MVSFNLLWASGFASPYLVTFLLILMGLLLLVLKSPKRCRTPASGYPPLPGPWGVPLLGNLLQLTKNPHKKLTSYRTQYGDVYQIRMGSRPTVILNGFDTVWRACVKQAEDFAGRPDFYLFRIIANGNSMGFGDYSRRWKMHRKIAQNSLNAIVGRRDNSIKEIIETEAIVLVSQFLKEGGKPFNPHDDIYLSVGHVICAICFGKRYRRDDPDFLRLVDMNDQFMAYATAGNLVNILPWIRPLLKRSLDNFVGILGLMNKFCDDKRREHLTNYNPDVMRDVTDILIRTVKETPKQEMKEAGLTDEHILTTVQELIGAGFDTIASTLQWAILYLMTHKHEQERMHEEIRRVVGMERVPQHEDLPCLPFTEAVLLEVLRYSSLFPLCLPHSTTQDTVLNGFFIPKNTTILVNLWSLVRDKDIFPDPERFYPDRFLNDNGQINRELAEHFLPFGAGRRRCPGEQLARLEVFIFLTTIIQRCCFAVPKGHQLPSITDSQFGLTLKPFPFQTSVSARV